MISSAKDDGSWATIHSDDPASRGGAASGDVSPKAATGGGVLRRGLALGLVALSALVFAVPSEAQNSAPTGKPTIDGTPHAGEILTASVSGIADADGLTTPGYTYQWIRVVIVGGGTSDITGATASTYTLTGDDVTHRVRVRVMFTDDGGTAETVNSDDYPSSGSVLSVASVPISFTATAGDGRVRLVWGNPTYVGVINLSEVRYQYRYAPGATVPDGTAWSNPTKFAQFRRLLDGLTNGTAHAFEVRAVNTVGPGPPATATATPMTVACPAPSLGNRRQHWRGELTIDASTPTPLDGEAPVSFGFVAHEDPPRASLSDTDFTLGAQAYGITAAWAGDVVGSGVFVPGDLVFGFDRDLTEAHKAALRLHVCGTAYDFSDALGPFDPHDYLWPDDLDWEVLPSRTLYLSLPPNNAATGKPAVSGAAQTAEVLTAAKGAIADADGLTLADATEAGFAYAYQWLRVDADSTSNPTDIPAATGARYTVTAADLGKKLKVRVSFTDDFNANEARTSDAYPSSGTVSRGKVVIGFRGVSVPEGVLGQLSFPEDVGTAVLTAYLDRSLETALSVPWFSSDQTAVSPDDYAGGQGTLTFAPGEIEQTISLPIVDDAIREDPDPVFGEDESFLVGLEFGDDYRFKNSGVVEVLILDNDGDRSVTPDPPGVTVSPSALTVPEGTTVTYTVRLDSKPTGTVTLTPSSDNPDVTFSPATLTFTTSNWATAQTVTVTAAQDSDTAEDTATIRHAVAGEDYGSVTAPSVPVTVPDDDVDPDPDPDDDTDGDGDEGGGNDTANNFPTADAGPDQTGVREGALVSLDGSGSSHPDDDPLRYRWNQLSGEPVVLSSQNVVNPSFTAPQGLTADAVLSFSLLVTDPDGRFDRDTVTITVEQGTSPSVTGGPTYYFPHLAVGVGWQTTITYINYSTQEVNCQTDFLSDQGTPLMVSFAGRGTVVRRTDVLPPGGSVHQETNVGLSAPLAPGWARGTCSGPLKASLLYRRYNSEGMPVAEAGVNATTVPATRFVTFAEQGEGRFGTGVAYANPSATAALVTFTARDAEGLVLDSFDRTLLPGGHAAQNMAPLFDLPSFTGSLEITSTAPIVTLSLNFEADPVFSSLPPGELDAAVQGSTTYYLSHLAVGASWQTTITYINYSPQEVTCQTEFLSDHGGPLMVSFADRGTIISRPDVLPPGGSVHQETNVELSAPLAPGWARATCSGPVKANLLFRLHNSEGVPVAEAGVNAATVPATRFVTFAEQGEGKFGTGVAYANPSDTAALITFTARDADGRVLASVDRTLLPNGHDAQNMAPLFGLSSFTGSLEVTSTEPIVSLSLNFEADPVFSSLPPGELDDAAQ